MTTTEEKSKYKAKPLSNLYNIITTNSDHVYGHKITETFGVIEAGYGRFDVPKGYQSPEGDRAACHGKFEALQRKSLDKFGEEVNAIINISPNPSSSEYVMGTAVHIDPIKEESPMRQKIMALKHGG
jgi:hypothetical protein